MEGDNDNIFGTNSEVQASVESELLFRIIVKRRHIRFKLNTMFVFFLSAYLYRAYCTSDRIAVSELALISPSISVFCITINLLKRCHHLYHKYRPG